MDWPPDRTMLALVAHAAGDSFAVSESGELALTVRDESRLMPFAQEALDELERRGWVRVAESGRTEITERGEYWVRRWLEQRMGKGVLRALKSFRVTGG